MKTNDKGMGELLELLKTHPELISALLFHPESIKRLLKSKAARRLILGVDTKAFLRQVAESKHGGPMALCLKRTVLLCAKGTQCDKGTVCTDDTSSTRHTARCRKAVRRI
jgi:hypothetical protein